MHIHTCMHNQTHIPSTHTNAGASANTAGYKKNSREGTHCIPVNDEYDPIGTRVNWNGAVASCARVSTPSWAKPPCDHAKAKVPSASATLVDAPNCQRGPAHSAAIGATAQTVRAVWWPSAEAPEGEGVCCSRYTFHQPEPATRQRTQTSQWQAHECIERIRITVTIKPKTWRMRQRDTYSGHTVDDYSILGKRDKFEFTVDDIVVQ
jgi:hypothetical protein